MVVDMLIGSETCRKTAGQGMFQYRLRAGAMGVILTVYARAPSRCPELSGVDDHTDPTENTGEP